MPLTGLGRSASVSAGTLAHAADRVILDRQALAPFIRSCMPHGVRHPGGETDRQSPCRGRAARILARTIRMPPVSSIWIPGRRWAPALGHPTVRNPVGGHARERHGGARRRGPDHQGAGGYGCPGASVLYLGITLSDERGEGERAHCRRSARMATPRRSPVEVLRSGCSARMSCREGSPNDVALPAQCLTALDRGSCAASAAAGGPSRRSTGRDRPVGDRHLPNGQNSGASATRRTDNPVRGVVRPYLRLATLRVNGFIGGVSDVGRITTPCR